MTANITILIADEMTADRLRLKTIFEQLGHTVIEAKSGPEAIKLFDPKAIQLVCLGLAEASQNSRSVALQLQRLAPDMYIPIVFLTRELDSDALSQCLEIKGADYISKPYNSALISAKLAVITRVLMMQKTLAEQNEALSKYNEMLLYGQDVAKVVYENITYSNCLNDPALKTFHHSSHTFNGDVILAAYKPNGGMHLLLGDFTGQGLSAAIGALPLADIFFDWTKKGFLMRQILPEINARLKRILPDDMFCSAAFIDIKANDKSIDVWNGGLPDLLLFTPQKKQARKLISKNLPLGVLSPREFEFAIDSLSFQNGDVLLAYSDGLYEAKTRQGEGFLEPKLAALYHSENGFTGGLDCLVAGMKQEGVLERSLDDISCLEVSLNSHIGVHSADSHEPSGTRGAPANFSFEYRLNAESLRSVDPLPYILQIITTVPGLSQYASHVFMILSELYSNALEHGVLQLTSAKKETLEGFSSYYEEREAALLALQEGFVNIQVSVVSNSTSGQLVLRVTDSGSGFDFESVECDLSRNDVPYNRGLALLKQLCEKLEFADGGRSVSAYFGWQQE
ncbi:fused response regulator/phosphatase [Marinomonas pollencensis]|uniref:Histidine kinase-like protein n=1 Tax=Marinomonas pollencensis TaxID=491954 RepID=A0A3E0DJJ6_9GAMM|nr:fused response regulator/phosphatase [Marinomonas pollencensis]REG82935.1 histidine kinase-like protein [Marinomonas pollencensis]